MEKHENQRTELDHWFEFNDVLELLTDSNDHQSLSPVASSFRDLWMRATFGMSKEWILRFAKILQRDVFANFLESQNLHHDINPPFNFLLYPREEKKWIDGIIYCKSTNI